MFYQVNPENKYRIAYFGGATEVLDAILTYIPTKNPNITRVVVLAYYQTITYTINNTVDCIITNKGILSYNDEEQFDFEKNIMNSEWFIGFEKAYPHASNLIKELWAEIEQIESIGIIHIAGN